MLFGCRCSGWPRQPSELSGSDGGRDGRGNGIVGQLHEDLELDSAQSMGVVSKTRGTGQPRPSCLAFTCLRSLSETTSCDHLACLGEHAHYCHPSEHCCHRCHRRQRSRSNDTLMHVLWTS